MKKPQDPQKKVFFNIKNGLLSKKFPISNLSINDLLNRITFITQFIPTNHIKNIGQKSIQAHLPISNRNIEQINTADLFSSPNMFLFMLTSVLGTAHAANNPKKGESVQKFYQSILSSFIKWGYIGYMIPNAVMGLHSLLEKTPTLLKQVKEIISTHYNESPAPKDTAQIFMIFCLLYYSHNIDSITPLDY